MCSFTCGNEDHKITLTVLNCPCVHIKSDKYLFLSKNTEFLKHVCTVRYNQMQAAINKAKKRELLKLFGGHI